MMEKRTYRRISKREMRRKRLIRHRIQLGCRGVMLGLLAALVIFAVKGDVNISALKTVELAGEDYPESLVALLENNPETQDFVMGYLENKDRQWEIDLTKEVVQGEIPLFLQWDKRWGYEEYGSDFMAVTGCGPTCLSMVVCGLSGSTEWNPLAVAQMAEKDGYYVPGAGSSWELMTDGATRLDLHGEEVIYDEAHILKELKNGNPIICVMRAGDFTTTGHFIVLTGVDEDGEITVCDPNSIKNSEKTWELGRLMPQIKNLWSYQYNIG